MENIVDCRECLPLYAHADPAPTLSFQLARSCHESTPPTPTPPTGTHLNSTTITPKRQYFLPAGTCDYDNGAVPARLCVWLLVRTCTRLHTTMQ